MTGLNYVRLLWGCDSGVGTDGGAPTARKGIATGRDPVGSRPVSRTHIASGPCREPASRGLLAHCRASRARITSGPPREPVSRAARLTSPLHERPVSRARVVSGPYRALASLGAARGAREPHPCGGFGTEASRTPSATASEIVGETTLAPTRAVNICCRSRPRESPRPALIWLIDFVMSPTI